MISAEVICDSISPAGKRLTTFRLRYPRFIHAEVMTHRMISRNASSSRAVPTAKLIEEVRSDALRAAPLFWGKNQKGMQAAEELDHITHEICDQITGVLIASSEKREAQKLWAEAALFAASRAEILTRLGAHKQIVNRILEPFIHINVAATATEWDNFFGLRLHKDAQPEMRMLAEAMWKARQESLPDYREPGDWHLPFIEQGDDRRIFDEYIKPKIYADKLPRDNAGPVRSETYKGLIKISVARCARVSYESFYPGNKRSTIEEDLALYDRLLGAQPLHASPAEHQATPDELTKHEGKLHLKPLGDYPQMRSLNDYGLQYWDWDHQNEHGNFVGWRQYRKMLPGEAIAPLPEGY